MLMQRLMAILNRFLYHGTHYMSNVQWIFPVAHIATLLLVARNIKCFGQGHQTHLKLTLIVVMTREMNWIHPQKLTMHEKSEDVLHTVPFKVLGSAYFVERQKCWEEAHKLLYERKVDVNAKLVPESNNKYDKNAIAVMLGFGNEWNKVGYIPTELTQFLHPLLNHNKITNVSLKHIKFRTTYQKVGFYATIEITRRGAWEQSVVKASKRVG